jgi:hypothetical protein
MEAEAVQSRSISPRLDDASFGAATPVTPKFISPADPAARWTGANVGSPSSPTTSSISTPRL